MAADRLLQIAPSLSSIMAKKHEKAWLCNQRDIRRIEYGKVNHLQMNSREEIWQAFEDYQLGRMGGLTL